MLILFFFFAAHLYCKIVLRSLNISSGGTSLKYSVNMLFTCILCYTPGPAVRLTVALSYVDSYGCHIYLCPSLSEIAVVFLAESYEFILERRYYVSCINYIKLSFR